MGKKIKISNIRGGDLGTEGSAYVIVTPRYSDTAIFSAKMITDFIETPELDSGEYSITVIKLIGPAYCKKTIPNETNPNYILIP
jgi:hypothetical protein